MTNGEFITEQLQAYGITASDLAKVQGVTLDAPLDVEVAEKGMIALIAELAVKPYQKSVSENGFSVSWDMSKVGWWYRLLCSKYGIKPNENVLESLGVSVIKDATNKW